MLIAAGATHLDVQRIGEGSGEPLLMVCATAQPRALWEPLAGAFAQQVPVIVYDHRGMGASEAGPEPVTLAGLAADAAAVLDALDVERAHLLGWSLGSAVCQEFALSYPERVSSLVLWGTWAKTDAYQRALFTAMRCPWAAGDLATAISLLALVFSPEAADDPGFTAHMGALLPAFPQTPEAVRAVVGQWDVDLAHDIRDRLAGVLAPTLVVAGERDIVTPPAHGREVAEAIPQATFELITGPRSSHALGLERADQFVPLVLGHLGRLAMISRSEGASV